MWPGWSATPDLSEVTVLRSVPGWTDTSPSSKTTLRPSVSRRTIRTNSWKTRGGSGLPTTNTDSQRRWLTSALDRLKDLYKWGDIDKKQYRAESGDIEQALQSLKTPACDESTMEKLAEFLRDVSSGWREANQEQRNKLARALFDSVWIEDQQVLGVTPRPELKPFFDLQYAGLSRNVLQIRPRPGSNRRSLA